MGGSDQRSASYWRDAHHAPARRAPHAHHRRQRSDGHLSLPRPHRPARKAPRCPDSHLTSAPSALAGRVYPGPTQGPCQRQDHGRQAVSSNSAPGHAGKIVTVVIEAPSVPGGAATPHLRKVAPTWTGTSWSIEGDISECFGSLDHDQRFLWLVRNMLTAGYLEDCRWGATLSGAPQGGVAPGPVQHLPAQVGRVRRDTSYPGIQPRRPPGTQPCL